MRSAKPHCQMMLDRMEERHMSQADLAWILGKPPSGVSLVVGGRCRLTAQAAVNYGAVLGIPPQDLLRAQDEWLLSESPADEVKAAAIRERAALVTAKVAARKEKKVEAELAILRRERASIDARIAQLTGANA